MCAIPVNIQLYWMWTDVHKVVVDLITSNVIPVQCNLLIIFRDVHV